MGLQRPVGRVQMSCLTGGRAEKKKKERDVIYGVVLLWTRLANTVLDTAE